MLLLQHLEEHQDDGWERPANVYLSQNLLRIVAGKSVTLSWTVDSTISHILLDQLVNVYGPLDAYVATLYPNPLREGP